MKYIVMCKVSGGQPRYVGIGTSTTENIHHAKVFDGLEAANKVAISTLSSLWERSILPYINPFTAQYHLTDLIKL